MDQEHKNKNSTKPKPAQTNDLKYVDDDAFPLAPPDGACIHYCYTVMLKPTGQIYINQTGKFVAPSSTGNNYILIIYNYGSNAILVTPFKNGSLNPF